MKRLNRALSNRDLKFSCTVLEEHVHIEFYNVRLTYTNIYAYIRVLNGNGLSRKMMNSVKRRNSGCITFNETIE